MADRIELDPIIHAASRLRIMTVLSRFDVGEEVSFERLRTLLDMTPGNLSVHLSKLEDAGYIATRKAFKQRKPVTYATLTPAGCAAYQNYRVQLRRLLDEGE